MDRLPAGGLGRGAARHAEELADELERAHEAQSVPVGREPARYHDVRAVHAVDCRCERIDHAPVPGGGERLLLDELRAQELEEVGLVPGLPVADAWQSVLAVVARRDGPGEAREVAGTRLDRALGKLPGGDGNAAALGP